MDNHALPVMLRPAADILTEHGLKYHVSRKNGVAWHNLETCPICGHSGFQCGLSENIGGKPIKGFKCQHSGTTDAKDFFYALGYREDELIKPTRTVDGLDRPNIESVLNLHDRLIRNPQALEWLSARGLTKKTIEHFYLGLSKKYANKDGLVSENCLVYPLLNRFCQPTKKNGYYNIPGVSLNPRDANGWMAGKVTCYYAGNPTAPNILVCEGAKDLWILWQHLQGTPLEQNILLVTSTHGRGTPEEWKDGAYWQNFEKIFLAQDNDPAGDEIVDKLLPLIAREAFRVKVPADCGKDWTDYFLTGKTFEDFEQLLQDPPLAKEAFLIRDQDDPASKKQGLFYLNEVDISGAFIDGYMYYPQRLLSRTVEKKEDKQGAVSEQCLESKKTVVVRSDGEMLTAYYVDAPKGTDDAARVLRLSDGTPLKRWPAPGPYSTWHWDSISKFINAKKKEKETKKKVRLTRPLDVLVREIQIYLSNQVWLPYHEDYTILSLAVVATYLQSVFDAVPLFLVTGPKGSGKTELGHAMCNICANANLIGQGSAAAIARLIDISRGFVCIDDLEGIGNRGKGNDAAFSDLVQGLKLSYKKATSKKLWIDMKTQATRWLDFYGIKMINNTTGVDEILGSRMITIRTRQMNRWEKDEWEKHRTKVSVPPAGLRDELHIWAFEHCKEVYKLYQERYNQGADRDEEIAAPLRIVAEMTGNTEIRSKLEVGLARQGTDRNHGDTVDDLLYEALRAIILQGYHEVMIPHIINELLKIVPDFYDMERTTDISPILRPQIITDTLRRNIWIDIDKKVPRKRIRGQQFRIYRLAKALVDELKEELQGEGIDIPEPQYGAENFCRMCEECQYRPSCAILKQEGKKESKQNIVRH